MAKIQFGSGVAAISGRTAGTVFSRNKGGAYMRRFSVPTNPRTTAQDAARNRLADASSAWRNLSQSERDAWAAYALTNPVLDRLGQAITLTGHQAFVRVRANYALVGLSMPNNFPPPPPEFINPVLSNANAVASVNGTVEVILGADFPMNSIIAIYASPPVSPGVTNTLSAQRLIHVQVFEGGPAVTNDPIDVSAGYAAVFGSITGQAGKKIMFRAVHFSNGLFSVPTQQSAIIA
ncbi:MAG: hypothetical protein RMK20_07000 [Verrucomicrobiales bacterium]|nr:hypothetical protein [Verrucomicrobiales bacterium]